MILMMNPLFAVTFLPKTFILGHILYVLFAHCQVVSVPNDFTHELASVQFLQKTVYVDPLPPVARMPECQKAWSNVLSHFQKIADASKCPFLQIKIFWQILCDKTETTSGDFKCGICAAPKSK